MRSFISKFAYLTLPENQFASLMYYWLLLFAASIGIFLFDLHTPLGVAAGTPYALMVFATLRFKENWTTYIATIIGILFTFVGFSLSSFSDLSTPMDVVLINRTLALMAITMAAYMVLKIKKINHELYLLMAETHIDPITQCKNSRAFKEETEIEIKRSKRYKRNLSLAIFDISDTSLSSSNQPEKPNIQVGNQPLRTISDEIKKSIRSSDQLYRVSHNRFAVVYAETELDKAKDTSEALCTNFSQLDRYDIQHIIGVNIGITTMNDRDNFNKLYERAEDALLIAKENGINQVATLPETFQLEKPHIPAILCRPRSG